MLSSKNDEQLTPVSEDIPLVSIIIPTYNRADVIGRAIHSAVNQSYSRVEVIVVDDASHDNTSEVVKTFADDKIRYKKHQTNKGGAEARNTGIELANGKYISFLDSDDKWRTEKIQCQVRRFKESDSRAGLIYTGIIYQESGFRKGNNYSSDEIKRKLRVGNPIGGCSSVMIKKEVVQSIGCFDRALPASQDREYWYRISKHYDIYYDHKFNVIKYSDSGKKQISSQPEKVCLGKLSFLKRHKNDFSKYQIAKTYFIISRVLRVNESKQKKKSVLRYSYKAVKMYPISPIFITYYILHLLPYEIEIILKSLLRLFKK
ncbi:glycosyltransferase family 2 protein [Salinibacter ruber]|uniref:glycosyltransferase family 2 protein n=1 Tax=Salinibacter ruber TaxID=146919 RepID=UPI002168189D|nr:glycosyltransferase involved in cell wall biosynthesis [Salinibacter ruber]